MELSNYSRLAYGNTMRGIATSKDQYHHQQQKLQHPGASQSVPCMIYAHCSSGEGAGLTTTLDCLSFLNEESPPPGIVNDNAETSPSMEHHLKAVFSDKFNDAVHNRLTTSFISPPEYSYCSDKEAYLTGPSTQFSGSSLQSDKSPQCCSSNASLSSPFTSSSGDSVCDGCLLRDGCRGNPHHELQTLHRLDRPLVPRAASQQQRESALSLSRAANCFKVEPLLHLLNSVRDSPQSTEIDDYSVTQSKVPLSVVASGVLVPTALGVHRNIPRVESASSAIRPSGVSGGTRDIGNGFQSLSDASGLKGRYSSNCFCRAETVAEQHDCEEDASFSGTQPTDLCQQKRKNGQPATPYGCERGCQDGYQKHSRTPASEAMATPLPLYEPIKTHREGWISKDQNHKSAFLERLQPGATTRALGFSNLSFQSFSGDLLDRWTAGRKESGSSSISGSLPFGQLKTQSLSPSTNGGIGSLSKASVGPGLENKAHIGELGRVELLLPARHTQRVSISSVDRGETLHASSSSPVADSFFQHFLQSSYRPSTETRSVAPYNRLLDDVYESDRVNQTVQAFLQQGIVSGCDSVSGEGMRPWHILEEISTGVTESQGKKSPPLAVAFPSWGTIESGPLAETTASGSHLQCLDASSEMTSKPLYKRQHAPGAPAHLQPWGPGSSLGSPVEDSHQQLSVLHPDEPSGNTSKKEGPSSALLLSSLSDASKDGGENGAISSKGICLVYKRIDEISDFPEPRLPPLKKQQQQPIVVESQVKISKKQRSLVPALQQRDDNDMKAEKWYSPCYSNRATPDQQNDHHCNQAGISDGMHHLSLTLVHPLRDKQGIWPLELSIKPSGQNVQYALAEAKYCDREKAVEHEETESPRRNIASHTANESSLHDVPIMVSTFGRDKDHRRFATQGNNKIMGPAKTTLKNSFKDSLPKNLQQHPATCKPCAFFWTKGCENGDQCQFCHEWHAPIRKKPMKDQKNLMIIARPDGKIELLRCTTEEALERS